MKKTLIVQKGGTYTNVSDYYSPKIIPAEEELKLTCGAKTLEIYQTTPQGEIHKSSDKQ